MKTADCRNWIREALGHILSDDSGAVADILLAETLGVERGRLLAMQDADVKPETAERITEAVRRLALGEPLQYVLGYCYFYGKRVKVGRGCFIPRSDTEILVKAAASLIGKKESVFADICSGSGCIPLAITSECPNCRGYALELSKKALEYTESNLSGVENVVIKRFDALDEEDYIALAEQNGEGVDLIISNPPYIPNEQIAALEPQMHFEPESALDGGEDGLRYYREIIRNAPILLKNDGAILFEVGINQADTVSAMLELNGYSVAVFKDYGNIDRVVLGKKY